MLIKALDAAPIINPNINKVTESLIFIEAKIIVNNTPKEPSAAADTIIQLLAIPESSKRSPASTPKKITIATPNPDPELIPKMNGPAIGFLNKVCICNPQIPSPPPTSMAVRALGIRNFSIIKCQELSTGGRNKIKSIILDKGMDTDPKLIFSTNKAINTPPNPINSRRHIFIEVSKYCVIIKFF